MLDANLKRLSATIFFCVLVVSINSAPSAFTQNLFSLGGAQAQSVAINQTFMEDSKSDVVAGNIIPCAAPAAVYGASVDAKIKLLNEASLARVILIDEDLEEYMVYEINSLLAENTTISIKDVCHETKLLNGIKPVQIRVDLLAAEMVVEKMTFATALPCVKADVFALQDQIKKEQHQQRIDLYNKMIKAKGEEWIAGPTEISMKSYQEKKCYYIGGELNPLPNTQGTEFYAGGVMPGRTNTPPVKFEAPAVSMYADTFDWRNRHGATNRLSPYYNSNSGGRVNGLCPPIRNQKSCGSCYIFASVGELECKYNLYYNKQLDVNLSEQHVGSCEYPGRMCNGGMPYRVSRWMVSDGIMDEASFRYTASNRTPCRDSSNNPKEHAFPKSYISLKGKEVNNHEDLKKCLIKYGPNAGADLSISHAMTLVGYRSRGSSFTYIYKNSWGGSGDKGYMYRKSPYGRSSWAVFPMKTRDCLKSRLYDNDDIRCVDLDKDGYYNWGIGPKPKTCPDGCPDEVDCDDSDPDLGPYDGNSGKCKEITSSIVPKKATFSGIKYKYSYDPIRSSATIHFEAPSAANATVTIYEVSGKQVKSLAINEVEKGIQKAVWTNDGSRIAKGIYVCTINVKTSDAMSSNSFKIAVLR